MCAPHTAPSDVFLVHRDGRGSAPLRLPHRLSHNGAGVVAGRASAPVGSIAGPPTRKRTPTCAMCVSLIAFDESKARSHHRKYMHWCNGNRLCGAGFALHMWDQMGIASWVEGLLELVGMRGASQNSTTANCQLKCKESQGSLLQQNLCMFDSSCTGCLNISNKLWRRGSCSCLVWQHSRCTSLWLQAPASRMSGFKSRPS